MQEEVLGLLLSFFLTISVNMFYSGHSIAVYILDINTGVQVVTQSSPLGKVHHLQMCLAV